MNAIKQHPDFPLLHLIFMLTALLVKFILFPKLIGMSLKGLGTAWLCFPMSWGEMISLQPVSLGEDMAVLGNVL